MNRRQRGATLILTAFALAALLGMAALAVDQAVVDLARERAQNVADAAALAGGEELPNTDLAAQAASQVIAANNLSGGMFVAAGITAPTTVTRDDGTTQTVGTGDALMIQGYTDAPISFGSVLGDAPTSQDGQADTFSASAQAAVVLQSSCGLPSGVGLAPFGLIGDDPNNADPTARYVATLLSTAAGAQTPQPARYQPTTTYGGQALTLRLNVWNTGGTLTIPGNLDPVTLGGSQSYLSSINGLSTTTLAIGQTLPVPTGQTAYYTQTYLNARLANSDTQFTHDDTGSQAYVDWFFGNPTYPIDTSQPSVTDPNTGVTYQYRLDPNRQALTDAHILIVPVVSQSAKNGIGPVTVLAFAVFFVEQPYKASNTTNALAQGRFIGITLPGSSGGACTAAGVAAPPQLVQ